MDKDVLEKNKWIERAAIAIACLLIGIGMGWKLEERQTQEALLEAQWQAEMNSPTEQTADGENAETTSNVPEIAVYIVGCVENPGVVRVKEDARMYEAVEIAVPQEEADLEQLPMARNLVDGETIYVPTKNSTDTQTTGEAGSAPSGDKININTATAQMLSASLPGIGDKMALKIVNYRETNGNFATEHDICNVSGIGENLYAQIANLITVQ